MGSTPYMQAYASVAFLCYCIVEIVIGGINIGDCDLWIPIGVYLIVAGAGNLFIGIIHQTTAANTFVILIIYLIFQTVWTVLGFITVWHFNSDCASKFSQASTIINLVPYLIALTLNSDKIKYAIPI